MHLSPQEWTVLNQQGAVPVCLSGVRCVLVRAEEYDRLKQHSPPAPTRPRQFNPDGPNGWNNDGDDVDVDDYVS